MRSSESDFDEELVKKIAIKYNIPIHIKKFNTESYAHKHLISIQMAARDLRYQWFEEIRHKESFNYIATAHHLNDSIETVLFNLAKGTGIEGLKGIPFQNGKVIRPLLFAEKEELITYAKERKLEYREDASNQSLKYHRNYIRHKIVPGLEEINPNFKNTIKSTLLRLEGIDRFIKSWLNTERKNFYEHRGKDIYLRKNFIREVNEPVILYEIIKSYGFSFDQSIKILNQLDGRSGAVFSSKEYNLNIDRDHLILSLIENSGEPYLIQPHDNLVQTGDLTLEFEKGDLDKLDIDYSGSCEFFDFEKISYPLLLRPWNEGDSFIPLGMKGKKKLSDFMIDKKIPLNLKGRIKVLISGTKIIWVVGYQIDNRYKLEKNTKKVLKVSYHENKDESI